jgi:hypothetical protein
MAIGEANPIPPLRRRIPLLSLPSVDTATTHASSLFFFNKWALYYLKSLNITVSLCITKMHIAVQEYPI